MIKGSFKFYPAKVQNFHHSTSLINERQIPPVHSLKLIKNSANLTHSKLILWEIINHNLDKINQEDF